MDYEIKYSKRRTLTLRVRDGRVYILAPFGTKSSYIDALLKKHESWIKNKVSVQSKRAEKENSLSPAEISEMKREAKAYFTEKTERFAALMNLKFGKIRISSAKARYGSCNSSGDISYSYLLMLYPEAAREYVIVHELAHTRQMNHGKEFYSLIESVMPDYKKRKELLKEAYE